MKNIFLVLLCVLTLSSCKNPISFPKINKTDSSFDDVLKESQITIDDLMMAKDLVAVADNNKLFLIDPEYAKPLEIFTFSKENEPTKKNIDNFLVSPNKEWIVWYSPLNGINALNIKSRKAQLVYEATEFLNTYPYFQFISNNNLLFISKEGNQLETVDLGNLKSKSVDIPYPYGNVFKVSPDENSVLFVSGYGQSQNKPKFMFTDIEGMFSKQFDANINIFDRNIVFWSPDSTGIFLINGSSLEFYPLMNPQEVYDYISIGKDNQIIRADRIDDTIFIFSKKGYWHVFDYESKKEIARTPTSIAKELNNPKFIPWSLGQFLVEETIEDGELIFNRLWISDFRGNKKIVMERYNSLIVETKLQQVE